MSTRYNDLSLTSFPDSVDVFKTFLNIEARDGTAIKGYTDAMQAGDQVLANQYLAQISSASQKIIQATDLNKLTEAILAIERFYSTDINDDIEQRQQAWKALIDNFSYISEWASGTPYKKNNLVSYTVGTKTNIYIAITDTPADIAPTNGNYWRVMTQRGKQGVSGVGLAYRAEWDASEDYQKDNAVTYDGALWQSLATNTNIKPGTNDSIWKLVMPYSVTVYPIQDTEPSNQSEGELWFDTAGNPTKYYKLEPLINPASASNITAGFEAYDGQGHLIVGTA